jgi:hypothetical protein
VAVDLGLDLQPLDLSLGLEGQLVPVGEFGLDLSAPVINVSLDYKIELGLEPSDAATRAGGMITQLADATGLSLFGGFIPTEQQAALSRQGALATEGPMALPDNAPAPQLTAFTHGGHTSSDGSLIFSEPQFSQAPVELFSGGRYTDYNLALQADAGTGDNVLATPAAAAAEIIADNDGGPQADASQLLDQAELDLIRGQSI